MHGMFELEKYLISKVEKPLNLGGQQFHKTSKILQKGQIVPKDIESNTLYLNNYINQNQFNQLYNAKW